MSPLCSAVQACAYSCRHSETIQAAVTNRNTAMPGRFANPVQVAHPVTAVTARMPRNTGLILRSPWRVVVVLLNLPGLAAGPRPVGTRPPDGRRDAARGLPDRTGRTRKTSRVGHRFR